MYNILGILKERFENNMHRHPNTTWDYVEALIDQKELLLDLKKMEDTGGDVDVIENLPEVGLAYIDFAKETPEGRRNVCYDQQALEARKKNKPKTSAMQMCEDMGCTLLNEQQYIHLQDIEKVDEKTSSWILTPSKIRALKGALFCDRRYDTVFVYHNGADSYYAVRGFRAYIKLEG